MSVADTESTAAAAAGQVTGTKVYVNMAMPDNAEVVAAQGADGVGLLRAEFMPKGSSSPRWSGSPSAYLVLVEVTKTVFYAEPMRLGGPTASHPRA